MFWIKSKTVKEYVKEANAAYQQENYSYAAKIAQKGLKKYPQNTELLLLLANSFYVKNDIIKAEKYYQKILNIDSTNYAALVNLAETYILQKKYDLALQYASKLNENYYNYFICGKVAFEQEDFAEAEQYFDVAISKNNNDFWVWNYLSQAAQKNTHYSKALDAALRAVETSDGADSQHMNFAYSLYEIALEKGQDYVDSWLQKWHNKYSENAIVKQSWYAFNPSNFYQRSSEQYIKKTFDEFADSFEDTLSQLEYRAPKLIAEKIKENISQFKSKKISILDVGCGTGLCGVELKKILPKGGIDGVDLSSQMLNCAKQKNIYKSLFCADVETFLCQHKKYYNLIVAADVFTYFGDLEKVIKGVFFSLEKDGLFVFSISVADDENLTWQQHLSGRFLHSKKYIKKCLSDCGFSSIKHTQCVLRKEGNKNVIGLIFSAIKT